MLYLKQNLNARAIAGLKSETKSVQANVDTLFDGKNFDLRGVEAGTDRRAVPCSAPSGNRACTKKVAPL